MSRPNSETSASPSSFEKQRDQLVQEITAAMDSVVYNLDILNRSLKDSIQVGNVFQDSSKLWANFYNNTQSQSSLISVEKPGESVQTRPIHEETVDMSKTAENPEIIQKKLYEEVPEVQLMTNDTVQGQVNAEESGHIEQTETEVGEHTPKSTEKLQPETNDTETLQVINASY